MAVVSELSCLPLARANSRPQRAFLHNSFDSSSVSPSSHVPVHLCSDACYCCPAFLHQPISSRFQQSQCLPMLESKCPPSDWAERRGDHELNYVSQHSPDISTVKSLNKTGVWCHVSWLLKLQVGSFSGLRQPNHD